MKLLFDWILCLFQGSVVVNAMSFMCWIVSVVVDTISNCFESGFVIVLHDLAVLIHHSVKNVI